MRLFRHLFLRVLALDVCMAVFATVAWLSHLQVLAPGRAASMFALLYLLHLLMWSVPLSRSCVQLSEWRKPGSTDAHLLSSDRLLNRLPRTQCMLHTLSWVLYFGVAALVSWFWLPEVIALGQLEFESMIFMLGTLMFGPPILIFVLFSILLEPELLELCERLSERKLEQARARVPMTSLLIALMLMLILSLSMWNAQELWLSKGQSIRAHAKTEVQLRALAGATAIERGDPRDQRELLETRELPAALGLSHDYQPLPGEQTVAIDLRREQVFAAAALSSGEWVYTELDIDFRRGEFWLQLLPSMLAFTLGSMICLLGALYLFRGPVERLRGNLRALVELGRLGQIGRLPVVRRDELGLITQEFNSMLDVFEELANAARAVSAGDLRIEITGQGDLQDAFRTMVARLAELVMQIRNAALEVASASTEIYATSQEQERAASEQSSSIDEIQTAMSELSRSALNIAMAADEVLSNAELTRSRSNEVVLAVTELRQRSTRIGELIELIRDVADRSDLLALNGSLEATRAGEAGRGFALVAAELRRLAERVTAAVGDVSTTVSAVDAANAATANATQGTLELAEGTTRVARQIVEVTGSQSAGTETVSLGVNDIAELINASASSTTQTRATAQALRARALQLEGLIEHFVLAGEDERSGPIKGAFIGDAHQP